VSASTSAGPRSLVDVSGLEVEDLEDDAGDDAAHQDGQDPVRAMDDTQEGAGDESGLADTYRMDTREADELRVLLDSASGDEATLD
jgi:hypothetical protein